MHRVEILSHSSTSRILEDLHDVYEYCHHCRNVPAQIKTFYHKLTHSDSDDNKYTPLQLAVYLDTPLMVQFLLLHYNGNSYPFVQI
jgi:hypothetical protein